MLRSSLDTDTTTSRLEEENEGSPPAETETNETLQGATQECGLVTPQRVVKFVQFQMANDSFLSDTADKDTSLLNNLVDTGFEFKSCGGTLDFLSEAALVCMETFVLLEASHCNCTDLSLSSFHQQESDDAMAGMKLFDKSLATRVEQMMDKSIVETLSYKVEKDEIAINETGTGFAQVSITIRNGHGQVTFMTAVVKFTFLADSSKLKSVVWHISDECLDPSHSDSDSASGESLYCQTSFPSVVSLDQSGDATADTKPPAEDGPGMNI